MRRISPPMSSGWAKSPPQCSPIPFSPFPPREGGLSLRENSGVRSLRGGAQGDGVGSLFSVLDLVFDGLHHLGTLFQVRLGVLPALADALAFIRIKRARLVDDPEFRPDVDDRAGTRDALAEHDVELRLLERRRDFVLYDLDPGPDTDHI